MSHNELIALTVDPDFLLAKDMVVEGISCRLLPYEQVQERET
jgi:hypothetical protein